jgi:glutamate/tyrosine decarboxylase-like PLP-dependent enzyme
MSVQTFGMAAFRRSIGQGIELAERAEAYIRESDVLQIANPASLGVVCFRVNPRTTELNDEQLEEINEAVQARVIEEAVAMMSSTRLRGLYSLRLCILNHTTTWEDVRFTLAAIEDFGRETISS